MANNGQCYVLKLRKRKWYVGYTEKGIERIETHLNENGSKWTRKYPPVKPIRPVMTELGQTKATPKNKPNNDEDKLTLKMMKKHGIQNVRGGSWCMVKMRKKTVRELEALLSSSGKNGNKKAKKSVEKGYCIRCRDSKTYDFEKPFCLECYRNMQEEGGEFYEDYCHGCGELANTHIDKPLCMKCWKKRK